MAQILEARGLLVTLSLLEGDPESLYGWAENFLSNDNFINRLNKKYSLFSNEVTTNHNMKKFLTLLIILLFNTHIYDF